MSYTRAAMGAASIASTQRRSSDYAAHRIAARGGRDRRGLQSECTTLARQVTVSAQQNRIRRAQENTQLNWPLNGLLASSMPANYSLLQRVAVNLPPATK